MPSFSILFCQNTKETHSVTKKPDFFDDLNLDIIINDITNGKKEYNLKPIFYNHLQDKETIIYRQEILKDIEREEIYECINSFSKSMQEIRKYKELSSRTSCKHQKERWLLNSADIYCSAVFNLKDSLLKQSPKSKGLKTFLDYLDRYLESENFKKLINRTNELNKKFNEILYCLHIKENKITIQRYEKEVDYAKEISSIFEKFTQKEYEEEYNVQFFQTEEINHVESSILKFAAKLHRETFEQLSDFFNHFKNFADKTIIKFEEEIQFYIAFLDYIKPLEEKNLNFCYPTVSKTDKNILSHNSFDIALAKKLYKENKNVVCNDFYFKDKERIFIITGPNQGGKTTFARAFGQIYYFSSLGLKVAGSKAILSIFDNIFTHFNKEEKMDSLQGGLYNELSKIHMIINQATSKSIIIMNEMFSSTSLEDALLLSKKILNCIAEKDILSVFVTFMDELTQLNEKIVSLTSMVDEQNITKRTYKILRKPPFSGSYALSLLEKYSLTYNSINNRIKKA